MTQEYRDDVTRKMKQLKPLTEDILKIIREEFPIGFGYTNFRPKSYARIIEKDVNKYKGLSARETQVKDLYAARLFATPDNRKDGESMKEMVLERFNKIFYRHPTINFISENKQKIINFFGEMRHINPKYVTFNGHIELQVVTSDEYHILAITHDEYTSNRKIPNKVRIGTNVIC